MAKRCVPQVVWHMAVEAMILMGIALPSLSHILRRPASRRHV